MRDFLHTAFRFWMTFSTIFLPFHEPIKEFSGQYLCLYDFMDFLKTKIILTKIDEDGFIYSNIFGGEGAYFRSDIVAQILRVGTIFASLGYGKLEDYSKLFKCLQKNFEGDNGALSFFPLHQSNNYGEIYRNVRCPMFASQALTFYNQLQNEGKIDKKLLGYII